MRPSTTQLLGWMPTLTAFVLPVHPRLSAITLTVWSIVATIHALSIAFSNEKSIERRALDPFVKWFAAGSMACYCAMCLGMLWTENVAEGWFALEVKFSFLLLPLLFWQSNAMLDEHWKYRALQSFQWGLLAFLAWRFFQAFWWQDIALLRYAGFAGPFHPSYIAFYLTTGILLISGSDFKGRALMVIGGLAIGLLASKAGWGVGLLVIAIEIMRRFKPAVKDARLLMASGFLLLLGAAWADGGRMQEFQHYLGSREEVVSNVKATSPQLNLSETIPEPKTGSTGGRMQAWKASMELLWCHPFGVGTGDIASSLARIYERDDSLYAKNKNMNPHSVWLQIGVRLGWLAMIGLFLGFLLLGWKAIQSGRWQLAIWTTAVIMNGTVESLFELQQGVVAILFLGLLLTSMEQKEWSTTKPSSGR